MFAALMGSAFLALCVWVRRRSKIIDRNVQHLNTQLAETQRLLEQAEHRSHRLISLLSELHEYKVEPTGRAPWNDLADFTAQTSGLLLGMEKVVLLRWDPEMSVYKGVAAKGLSPQQLAELRVRPGEGILGNAAQGGKILNVHEPGPLSAIPQENFLSVPYLVLPLWVHSQVNGLFVLCRPHESRIGPESVRLATLLAKQAQLTMENLDLYENRQRVFGEVVSALAAALGSKDPESQAHIERCRTLISAVAREMHLPALLAEQLEFGALLHDLGKLGIEEAILAKPGPLTDEEYALVKKHSEIGHRLLRDIGFLKGVAPIVLYHHEWVNGQGYPEGLAGDEIPLGARLVAVVDAWDTMVSDQPYRKALSRNNAIAELRQQAGTQFDPKLVDVFLRVMDQQERAAARPPADATVQPNG